MSTLREAAQQALEAMQNTSPAGWSMKRDKQFYAAITDLRAALAQQEQTITPAELSAALGWPGGISTPVLGKVELLRMVAQQEQEPVAWRYQNSNTEREYLVWNKGTGGRNWTPLYTHPLRREWQGLMNKEIVQIVTDNLTGGDWIDVARAIEQALKERNNG